MSLATFNKIRTALKVNRIVLGFTAGILVWFLFAYGFHKPFEYTPHFSVFFMMLVSGIYVPKKAAWWAGIIGLVAGIVWGVVFFVQSIASKGLFELIGVMIGIFLTIILNIVMHMILGFLFGTVWKLHKEGAIF